MVIDTIGTGLYLPFTVLYFTARTHLSIAQVGLGLSIAAGAGLALSPVLGGSVDANGAKPVLIASNIIRFVAFAAAPLVGAMWSLVVVTFAMEIGAERRQPRAGRLVDLDHSGRGSCDGSCTLLRSLANGAYRPTIRSPGSRKRGIGPALFTWLLSVQSVLPWIFLAAMAALGTVTIPTVGRLLAPRLQGQIMDAGRET